MAKVRGRGKVGDVVKIDLGNENFGYGRILLTPLMAFYDFQSQKSILASEVIQFPVLFIVAVMHKAIKSEKWDLIGNFPLEEHFNIEPKFFKQDIISKKFYIYDDVKDIPATRENCIGLERAAVWEAIHVENRLRNHFAGLPDPMTERLKVPSELTNQ
jgi:hypothetical protein